MKIHKHQEIVIETRKYLIVPLEDYEELLALRGLSSGNEILNDLGVILKKRRSELALTVVQMAGYLKITPAQVSRLENGQKPQLKTLMNIMEKLK